MEDLPLLRELARSACEPLAARGQWLACAESCTGGLLSSLLTDNAGSSAYVKGSVVAYSNAVKESVLGVSPETLKKHGAVSAPCAREMAEGVKRALGADMALATTGIAGPGGATPDKPVGLVYIALAGSKKTLVSENHFSGTREEVKLQAAAAALYMLREYHEI